jgi:phosphoribosylformylglycinamidine synthase
VIGHLTDTGRIVVRHRGELQADIELAPLADQAPLYSRPYTEPVKAAPLALPADPVGSLPALETLIGCPDLCSRAWIWNQYDTTVGGQTVRRPGTADAAIVRLEDTDKALALTTDCTPRYCAANPEKPAIMGQIVAAIRGMAASCRALDFPVVSGNVSLYNETQGTAILPTPAIGGLGVIEPASRAVGLAPAAGHELVLLGETRGHLGRSLWLREIIGQEVGAPPPVDLAAERRTGDFVRGRIAAGAIAACHDVSDGGLLVAVAEMALGGHVGVTLLPAPDDIAPHAFWFGEDQARYIAATGDASGLLAQAAASGIPARRMGRASGDHLTLADGATISLSRLRERHESFFAAWMNP